MVETYYETKRNHKSVGKLLKEDFSAKIFIRASKGVMQTIPYLV